MRTRISLLRKFSTNTAIFFILNGLATISGISTGRNFAEAQPSDPRAETDSRPSEPPNASPNASPNSAKPGAKPTATPAKPAVKPMPAKPGAPKPTPVPTSLETSRKFPKVVTKLMMDDLSNGRGRATKVGSHLVIHFQSWLYDPTQPLGRGPQFESTHGKAPYKLTLGNPETPHIRGWEEGLSDMKVGGKRRLIIPADLAYGANGAGQVIPPGATLLYEIELIDVE